MKLITLAVLCIALPRLCMSQSIFPGNDTSLISGKELKVKPLPEGIVQYGYEGFYKDEKRKKVFECCDGRSSKYSSLVGQTFKVVSIKPYEGTLKRTNYVLQLANDQLGTVYFDYEPHNDLKWFFEFVGNLNLPKDFFCRGVDSIYDKFTGETTYLTDYSEGIRFVKVRSADKSNYFITKNTPGQTLNIGEKGFYILLANNKRIDKPDAKVKAEAGPYSGYVFSVFTQLSDADIDLLLNNEITDTRLYIYDSQINDGKKLIEYLKCLIAK